MDAFRSVDADTSDAQLIIFKCLRAGEAHLSELFAVFLILGNHSPWTAAYNPSKYDRGERAKQGRNPHLRECFQVYREDHTGGSSALPFRV